MKVKIGDVFISNGDKESPANFDVQESRLSQVVSGLRWAKQKAFDRQNRKTVVTFGVSRCHSSIGAAERFILLHGPSVPTSGLVQFILSDNTTIFMDTISCVCENVKNTIIGSSTNHNYTLVGGMPTATKPAS